MPDFHYSKWVPGGTPRTEFKQLDSLKYDADVEDKWLIDQLSDVEWKPDGVSPNETLLLPSAQMQFKLDAATFVNPGSMAPGKAVYLLSIGTGEWFFEVHKEAEAHFEKEEFRCLFSVQTIFSLEANTDTIYDAMMGNEVGGGRITGVSEVQIDDFWITQYDTSAEIEQLITDKVFPYNIGGEENWKSAWKKNRILFKIPPEYSVREYSGNLSLGTLYASFTFPIYNTSRASGAYYVKPLVKNAQNVYEWGALKNDFYIEIKDPKSKIKLTLVDQQMQRILMPNSSIYLRTVRSGSVIVPYSHAATDDILGKYLITYQDKEKSIVLETSKDSKEWSKKLLIPASDPGAGRYPSFLINDAGVVKLIYEKNDGAYLPTLSATAGVFPLGGIGTKDSGIWETYIDNIDFAPSGPVKFKSTGNQRLEKKVIQGNSPVPKFDKTTGRSTMFYWTPTRLVQGGTGSTGSRNSSTGARSTTGGSSTLGSMVTLGGIYRVYSKDNDQWDESNPQLIIPIINDDTTIIPQQVVGVDNIDSGGFLIVWIDKDGIAHKETINTLEKGKRVLT